MFLILLVSISNKEFDIKEFYDLIPPNHEWKKIGDVKISKSVKEINTIEFNRTLNGVAWNSYKISQDEDFLINFDLIIDGLTNLNDKSEKFFKILMASNFIENGKEKRGVNFEKTINISIGFKFNKIKEEVKGNFNISFIKNLEGDETFTSIKKTHLFNEILKYNKINIKIEIIEKQLSFKIIIQK